MEKEREIFDKNLFSLPVSFKFLRVYPKLKRIEFSIFVPMKKYSTNNYPVHSHYKPISKIVIEDSFNVDSPDEQE
ncbi:hypothetical protein SanaruYs_11160 [Chryseotalea sanaruensis]|uniref:Uncharacterized protein n=1 Tax=Chryseotalea sanaruensis TaxID=2482724 RepID=A0A401U7P2_9BACT|nr:hypothetical protein [Chryseotalea sanaruensis]GCC50897.1 hypothetical protein SanaruYs_11160 [Chryseotalea sanaruensis]